MSIYNQIKEAIISGYYKPGERLTEEKLAEDFKISRTPIRQAVQQLQYEGLITPLKRGIEVRAFKYNDVVQIYNLRALLEGYATSEAAIHRTSAEIEKMKFINKSFKKAIDAYRSSNKNQDLLLAIIKANSEFHDVILNATKNNYLKNHIKKVVVLPLVFRSFYWYEYEEMLRSYDIHKRIIRAIEEKDFNRANNAMSEHVYLAKEHVLNYTSEINNIIEGEI